MKYKYHGEISFTMDKNHPDIKHVEDWAEDKIYTFGDEYLFGMNYTEEEIIPYIKHDLMLVAGGGYNADYIHNVVFDIRKI